MMKLYDPLETVRTKYLFLTGKGGVGKTSVACATAVALADAGHKVLLISTDPASNLQDVFSMELSDKATPIPEAANLSVANLDPIQAAAPIGKVSLVRIAASCRRRPCAIWKSSCPALVLSKLRPSMSLLISSLMRL